MRIAILSNVNIDSLVQRIDDYQVYKPDGYGVWFQELVDSESKLYKFDPKAIFLILDAEQLFLNLKEKDIYSEIEKLFTSFDLLVSEHEDIPFFISDLDYHSRKLRASDERKYERFVEIAWYEDLVNLSNKNSNVHIFNLKDLVEKYGRNSFYNYKYWYLAGIKYSALAEDAIVKEVKRQLNSLQGKRKKCVVLDLDNTLWGGVVGETGLEGIELSEYKEGARYKDFQKRLKELKNMGVILAVVSKNNEEDVFEVFEKHKHMVLKKEDFAVMKINWEPKSENLSKVVKELNIGIDSIVFIDDNPVERELVAKSFPEVIVPEFPRDTSKLVEFIENIYEDYFFVLRFTEEDKKKTQMYIQNVKRAELKEKAGSLEEFLRDLETKIYVWKLKDSDVPRAAQLTQKTNQFNLTTRRYTEGDIRRLAKNNNCDIYIASVEDKFGDNGKVVLTIIKKDPEKKEAEVDTFLMSCRVMGRFIEDQFLDYVEQRLKEEGIERIKAFYFPTRRNKPVENLFERLGYELLKVDQNGNKFYVRNLLHPVKRKRFSLLIEKNSN